MYFFHPNTLNFQMRHFWISFDSAMHNTMFSYNNKLKHRQNTTKKSTRRRRMNGVKGCLNVRGLTIQKVKKCVKDRKEWKRILGKRRR